MMQSWPQHLLLLLSLVVLCVQSPPPPQHKQFARRSTIHSSRDSTIHSSRDSTIHSSRDSSRDSRQPTPEQELLARYLLSRLVEVGEMSQVKVAERRQDQYQAPSIVYPQVSAQSITQPLSKLLEKAKESIEVIDFTKNSHVRKVRQPEVSPATKTSRFSPSEAIPSFLPFPGSKSSAPLSECVDCVGEGSNSHSRFSMPLASLGEKKYYLGIFFKANWYKAEQYCRFHGMHLASINSAEEQSNLEEHIQSFGMGHEHFWTSGTDQAEEGKFFWMSTGKPVTYENWNAGEPNNFQYENGEQEHCLELWNRDGKGLRWNDTPCSFETFFVCEV